METNFFKNLSAIHGQCEWIIVIKQIEVDNLVVSVLFNDEKCGDPARKIIPPLTFSSKPEILDKVFFEDLHTAMVGTIEVHNSMEHYLKQQESAKKQSQLSKDAIAKQVKQKSIPVNKYDAALQSATELESEGKYKEAWMKIPDPSEYPEKAEFLRKRRQELSAHFPPDLFNS